MATATHLPPMLAAILQAARAKFPRHDWAAVEEHIHRAWNAVSHEAAWEEVSDHARRAWESPIQVP